jgi:drug/metabolite transporter (DMT)-like permease
LVSESRVRIANTTSEASTMASSPSARSSRSALIFGTLGVVGFSLTLPATRAAVPELGPIVVGLGRALVASVLAAIWLAFAREGLPERAQWPSLVIVALGVVVGFPVLSSIALKSVPAAHGAVVTGLIPAATAVMAVLRAHERPRPIFWFGVVLGVIAVVVFASIEGAGRPQAADLVLFAAIVSAAIGYAEGGRLARQMGGARVVSWALVISAPFLAPFVVAQVVEHGLHAGARAWIGFAYVSCISMFAAFFAWYRGLALGGVARIGQIQLVQPVLTLIAASVLIGEGVRMRTWIAALLVVAVAGLALVLGRPKTSPANSAGFARSRAVR